MADATITIRGHEIPFWKYALDEPGGRVRTVDECYDVADLGNSDYRVSEDRIHGPLLAASPRMYQACERARALLGDLVEGRGVLSDDCTKVLQLLNGAVAAAGGEVVPFRVSSGPTVVANPNSRPRVRSRRLVL